jgi:hypothetical protein
MRLGHQPRDTGGTTTLGLNSRAAPAGGYRERWIRRPRGERLQPAGRQHTLELACRESPLPTAALAQRLTPRVAFQITQM